MFWETCRQCGQINMDSSICAKCHKMNIKKQRELKKLEKERNK